MGPFIAAMMAIPIANKIKEGQATVNDKLEQTRQDRLKEGQTGGGKEGGGNDGEKQDEKLSAEEQGIIKMMGVKPETYLESRKQLAGGM